jgi:Cytidylate kinase-like family
VFEGAAAADSCVIVGRSAPYLLRNRQDTFHVFVSAPLEKKIRPVRALGKSEEVLQKGMAQPAPLSSDDRFIGGGRCGGADHSGRDADAKRSSKE